MNNWLIEIPKSKAVLVMANIVWKILLCLWTLNDEQHLTLNFKYLSLDLIGISSDKSASLTAKVSLRFLELENISTINNYISSTQVLQQDDLFSLAIFLITITMVSVLQSWLSLLLSLRCSFFSCFFFSWLPYGSSAWGFYTNQNHPHSLSTLSSRLFSWNIFFLKPLTYKR